MSAIDVERLSLVLVRLGDIDLDDRRFEVRRAARAQEPDTKRAVGKASGQEIRRPVLWVPTAPYTILRGFRYLDALVRGTSREGGSDWHDEPVEVAFLSESEDALDWVDAMVVACTGERDKRFRLTTHEWARAVRRLRALHASEDSVARLLRTAGVCKRTGDRANRVSRAPRDIWQSLESGSLTLYQIESLLRDIRCVEQRADAVANTSERVESADLNMASILSLVEGEVEGQAPGEEHEWEAEEADSSGSDSARRDPSRRSRFVTFTRKQRLIIYHQNVGARTDPSELRRLERALTTAARVIRSWISGDRSPRQPVRKRKDATGHDEGRRGPR